MASLHKFHLLVFLMEMRRVHCEVRAECIYIYIYIYIYEKGVYRVLVGKPEGKRPLGRPRRRWVDNIRMDLQEVGYAYMDWIGLARDR